VARLFLDLLSMHKFLLGGALLATALALPAQSPLSTLFAGGNGLGTGSTIYFDVVLNAPLTFTQFDVNSSSAASTTGTLDVRWCSGSYVGNDTNAAAWTLGGSGPITALGAGLASPCVIAPFSLPPGNYGLAITFTGIGQNYTNGNGNTTPGSGTNQTYTRNELTLLAGASSGGAPGTAICCNPRVFNGNIHYSVGSGGVVATRTSYGTGCIDRFASFYELFGTGTFDLAAATTNSIQMIPSGGGYVVLPGSNQWFTPIAPNLALGDDQVSAAQALPFAFTTAAGLVTNNLYICSNGYVWPTANTNAGCCNGDPALLRTQGERFAVMWQDLDPRTTGSIHFDVDPSGSTVYATWLNVPEYANAGNLCTFQAAFSANGIVEYRWRTGGNVTHSALVGWSPGANNRDPGNRDISATLPFTTAADQTGVALAASARPVVGGNVTLTTSNIPAGAPFGALLLGLTQFNPGIQVPILPTGCVQHNEALSSVLFFPAGTTANSVLGFLNPVANFPGVELQVQSAVYTGSPLALTSNGVALKIGTL
jgi:hypothetical protein